MIAVSEVSVALRAVWVKERVSLHAVLGALGRPLGENRTQQIRCLVHADQRPSARFHAEENRLDRFTCGRGWDQVGLVGAVKRLSQAASVTWLEERFAIAFDQTSLADQLRLTLAQVPVASARPMCAAVERTLIGRRGSLGMETFTRACLALDLVRYQVASGRLGPEGATGQLERILTFVME